jgi:hypothetical protein
MANGCSVEKYPNLKRWLKEASENSMLRVLCINILSEISFGNISQSDLEKILSKLENLIGERRKKGYQTKKQIEDANEDEFIGKGQEIETDDNEIFSIVLSLERMRNFCLGDGYGWDMGTKIDSPESIENLEILIETHNNISPVFVNFSGKNDIFWFTKAESLRSIKQENEKGDVASSIRNALGLFSEAGGILIEIQFESTHIENGKKPTIFDADFNVFFIPKSRKNKWGFTLDSETLTESLPEAIHEKKTNWPEIYEYNILGNPKPSKFPPKKKWKELRKNSLHTLCMEGRIHKDTVCEYIVTEKEDWK